MLVVDDHIVFVEIAPFGVKERSPTPIEFVIQPREECCARASDRDPQICSATKGFHAHFLFLDDLEADRERVGRLFLFVFPGAALLELQLARTNLHRVERDDFPMIAAGITRIELV